MSDLILIFCLKNLPFYVIIWTISKIKWNCAEGLIFIIWRICIPLDCCNRGLHQKKQFKLMTL